VASLTEDGRVALILERLESVILEKGGWRAKCPAHDDSNPSLRVTVAPDGKILLSCRSARCTAVAIMGALGLSMRTLFPTGSGNGNGAPTGKAPAPMATKKPWGRTVASYDYLDENGALLFQVCRDEHKNFRQRRPKAHADPGEDQWEYSVEGARRVLYRLPEVLSAKGFGLPIFVVEGEKDADSLCALGLPATTAPRGAAAEWEREYTEQLRGADLVVILPDNDEPGLAHARKVRAALRGHVKRTRTVALPGLGHKGDVSDWIAAGGDRLALEKLTYSPQKHEGWLSARVLMNTPMAPVEWLIPGLVVAGGIHILSGDSGSWKSWMTICKALSLATEAKFLGHFPVRRARTMIVSADEPAQETRRKIQMLVAGGGFPYREGSDPLDTDINIKPEPTNLSDPGELEALADAVADWGPDYLIIDNLQACLDGDSNAAEFAKAARRVANVIRQAHSCAIEFIHHWNKPSKDRSSRPADRLAGTRQLRALVDLHVSIEREPDVDIGTVTVDKNRRGPEMLPFCFIPRILEREGMAALEYSGASAVAVATDGCVREVRDLLKADPSKVWLQPQLVAHFKGLYTDKQVHGAVEELSRCNTIFVDRKKGRQGGNRIQWRADDTGAMLLAIDPPSDGKTGAAGGGG
jgi:putative DNA primase/helicase